MRSSSFAKAKSLVCVPRHVTIMAAILMLSLVPSAQCQKRQVPSDPGSSFEFDEVDLDGNGCVEGPEEMQKFRMYVGRILGQALNLGGVERALRSGRITHSADVNGDGRICECDLLNVLLTESEAPGPHRHAFRVREDGSFFDDVDKDQDGFLGDASEKEAMAQKLALCVPEDKARALVEDMARLQLDDGKLARSEYMLFLKPLNDRAQGFSLRRQHFLNPNLNLNLNLNHSHSLNHSLNSIFKVNLNHRFRLNNLKVSLKVNFNHSFSLNNLKVNLNLSLNRCLNLHLHQTLCLSHLPRRLQLKTSRTVTDKQRQVKVKVAQENGFHLKQLDSLPSLQASTQSHSIHQDNLNPISNLVTCSLQSSQDQVFNT